MSQPLRRCCLILCILCLGATCLRPLAASEAVDDLLNDLAQSVPADELAEPGSLLWPQMVAEAAEQAEALGFEGSDAQALRLAAAEAWIAAAEAERAQQLALAVLEEPSLDDANRQRAGLALVAAWQLLAERSGDGDEAAAAIPPDPAAYLHDLGIFNNVVLARAHTVAGIMNFGAPGSEQTASLQHFDAALGLLKDAAPEHRTPIFTLRLHAMELADDSTDQIQAWLDGHRGDPGLAPILDALFTASQGLVGQAAPPLRAAHLGNPDDDQKFVLAAAPGKTTLLFFSASWSQRALTLTPVVVALQQAQGDALQVIEISLDTADTMAQIPAYRARFGITHPIIGEGLGWDGALDDLWHIDAIPTILIVDGEGIVRSTNLAGEDPAATRTRIEQLLESLAND